MTKGINIVPFFFFQLLQLMVTMADEECIFFASFMMMEDNLGDTADSSADDHHSISSILLVMFQYNYIPIPIISPFIPMNSQVGAYMSIAIYKTMCHGQSWFVYTYWRMVINPLSNLAVVRISILGWMTINHIYPYMMFVVIFTLYSSIYIYPLSLSLSLHVYIYIIYIYTLWLFNVAMENGPFIDDL